MEDLMNDISNRINFETKSLGKFIGNEHKIIIAKSYLCMSSCFKAKGTLKSCDHCAKKCSGYVSLAHNEVQHEVENIKNAFRDCANDCDDKFGIHYSEGLKGCINQCATDTVNSLQKFKNSAKEIMKKYSEK